MRKNKPTWFILRREPYYHKLQYSKTPKFDIAAAVFGVAVGAFVVYLTLASVGSVSSDLSDLTVLVWYSFLLFQTIRMYMFLQKTNSLQTTGFFGLFVLFFKELFGAVRAFFTKKIKKPNKQTLLFHVFS